MLATEKANSAKKPCAIYEDLVVLFLPSVLHCCKTHFIEVDCDQSMVSEFLRSRFHFHCVTAGSVKGEHLGRCGLAKVGAVTQLG